MESFAKQDARFFEGLPNGRNSIINFWYNAIFGQQIGVEGSPLCGRRLRKLRSQSFRREAVVFEMVQPAGRQVRRMDASAGEDERLGEEFAFGTAL